MRVRIVIEPDVGPEHGVLKHRVFEVLARRPKSERFDGGYWVMGERGKPVLVLEHEACEYPEGWN